MDAAGAGCAAGLSPGETQASLQKHTSLPFPPTPQQPSCLTQWPAPMLPQLKPEMQPHVLPSTALRQEGR